jgi:hypothetical protein
MGKNWSGQMSLSGTDQRYNNAKGGKVDKGKIIRIPRCTGTKVNCKTGTS